MRRERLLGILHLGLLRVQSLREKSVKYEIKREVSHSNFEIFYMPLNCTAFLVRIYLSYTEISTTIFAS